VAIVARVVGKVTAFMPPFALQIANTRPKANDAPSLTSPFASTRLILSSTIENVLDGKTSDMNARCLLIVLGSANRAMTIQGCDRREYGEQAVEHDACGHCQQSVLTDLVVGSLQTSIHPDPAD
jgi:hypothetical protein